MTPRPSADAHLHPATDAQRALDRRAFDLLCLAVAAVLAAHVPHLPLWLSPALALVLAVRWAQRRWRGGRVPTLLKLPLVAALPLAILAAYGTPFGRAPGSALAVGMLVLKLLESERARDARSAIAFGSFVAMSALLFGQSLPMTVLVALALLPMLATLQALQPAAAMPRFAHAFARPALLLAASLPLALVAFLFVPRLSAPLWGAPGADQARTGISPRMAPGDFIDLLTDDRPALRVAFDGAPPPPAQRYFRGLVMWRFDGRAWTATDAAPSAAPEPLRPQAATVAYEVTLEPTGRHWLFALDTPLAPPADATMSAARELARARAIDAVLHYRVVSAPQRALAPTLGDAERRRGLQLPPGFDPRARELAEDWRRRYGGDAHAVAGAALALFHDGGFGYNLAAPPLGRDSVDDFLFGTKEGFCEHYASSFVFLMRAAGIPARVVTGYQGGYWNALGGYLLVRQSDAHAWAEVWLPGQGWTRYDPTAAVRPERVVLGAAAGAAGQGAWYQADWLQAARNRWDIVNRLWDRTVVGFDSLRQRGLLTPFGVERADWGALAAALAALSALVLSASLLLALAQRDRRDPLAAAQARLERRLARAGVARRPAEGPQHYFMRAARALPAQRAELHALGEAYLALRYACAAPADEPLRNYLIQVRRFRPRRVVQ
ncbi:MAG: DUF3488 and transglutaminase-like domain-containing protein [Mizugakiibacter sp.]|uniref:transglutaminase TgpA family protein n=1 Tax=Mizugakiibacter sp. TaxID=1972610 RepID=UPI0031BD8B71|nr:DUF3488 and transglutaminase-like domain-containing protein [Xanthomonadaceae bacterium]